MHSITTNSNTPIHPDHSYMNIQHNSPSLCRRDISTKEKKYQLLQQHKVSFLGAHYIHLVCYICQMLLQLERRPTVRCELTP